MNYKVFFADPSSCTDEGCGLQPLAGIAGLNPAGGMDVCFL